ncbi:MAG: type VI secretion system tube protein Hcp [Terracidiphilus sp.]|jgi:type VI secretion system secreted protein Hcp
MASKDVKQFLLEIKLQTQGKIKGSSTKGHGNVNNSKGILCHSFSYGVETPYDAASGLPTGKRQHKPISIVREVDSASPLLLHACATNEGFTTATLSFFKPGKSGKETVYQTIELTNGAITGVRLASPRLGKNRESTTPGKKLESITLNYEELTVNGLKGGIVPNSLIG